MRNIGWLIAGFALYKLSKVLEGLGDAAPLAVGGVSAERALWHGAALVILVAGLACFVRALVLAWRAIRGGAPKTVPPAPEAGTPDPSEAFDPDAALARYLANRDPSLPAAEKPAPPRGPGFGRRGL